MITAPEALPSVSPKSDRLRLDFKQRVLQTRREAQTPPAASAVSGGNRHSDERTTRHIPVVQVAFRVLMIRWILQFALRIAFRCVLHRCGSQDIRR